MKIMPFLAAGFRNQRQFDGVVPIRAISPQREFKGRIGWWSCLSRASIRYLAHVIACPFVWAGYGFGPRAATRHFPCRVAASFGLFGRFGRNVFLRGGNRG